MAVYFAFLKPGDQDADHDLSHGAILTHGNKANFSANSSRSSIMGSQGGRAHRLRSTRQNGPRTPAQNDHRWRQRVSPHYRLRPHGEISREVGRSCWPILPISPGLVAAGLHPSPMGHADFVTTTTHKTLRGPRGGLILCPEKYAKEIDSQLFPGIQGDP